MTLFCRAFGSLSPEEKEVGGQKAVGLCRSQLLLRLCPLAPSPHLTVSPSPFSQPCASSLLCLLARQPGFVSQGLSSVHCKEAEGLLPTRGEGLLGWPGEKGLQSGGVGWEQWNWIDFAHPRGWEIDHFSETFLLERQARFWSASHFPLGTGEGRPAYGGQGDRHELRLSAH